MNRNPFIGQDAAVELRGAAASAHVPASARVYEEMRRRIISLSLPPGETLVRSDLAERYNVSQSPVREAIARLEQDGLVISYPQSRTVVSRIDVERVREEHFLRNAVECDVVRQLALHAEPAALKKAQGFLKMQEALGDDLEQVDLFKQLDEAFHEALFAGVAQSSLHRHVQRHCCNLARLRSLDLPREGKIASVLKQHLAVIEAVEAGDPNAATEAMRRHLSGTLALLPTLLAEHPDLFVNA